MKILFTGGGTAGHIFPIIAVIKEIKKRFRGDHLDFFYVGPKDKFALEIFSKEGVNVRSISAGKIRRYFSILNFFDFFKFPIGFLQSFYYVFVISPDLIFSKGGYGSITTTLAGKILQVPIFLHESDIYPGLANRKSSKYALEIFTSFPVEKTPCFPKDKMIFVGNPIRESILEGSKEEAKRIFNLRGGKPVLLIIGGSQGARIINDTLLIILSDLLKDFEVIHQTGIANFKEVKEESEVILNEENKNFYHPMGFLDEDFFPHAYAVSDLIISRAGAGSIFEIAALSKPSILIPLSKSANDHQLKNAYAYAENGAALVLEESNFTSHFFLERIKFLFSEPQRLKEMSQRAREFSTPNSAGILAEYIGAYLKQ